MKKQNPKGGKYCMGWYFTDEDLRRERIAIIKSNIFFEKYGKPSVNRDKPPEWATFDALAAMYKNYPINLTEIARCPFVRRRIISRNDSKKTYEYNVSDVQREIEDLVKH